MTQPPGECDGTIALELAVWLDLPEAAERPVDASSVPLVDEEQAVSGGIGPDTPALQHRLGVLRQLLGDSQWKRSAETAWSLYWMCDANEASSLFSVTNISCVRRSGTK